MIRKKKKIKEQKTKAKAKKHIHFFENNDNNRDMKQCARKFYEIMQKTDGYVDGIYILKKLKESHLDLRGNPFMLWRIWRQVENDFPHSITFAPQSSCFWTNKPSGWKYLGISQEEY